MSSIKRAYEAGFDAGYLAGRDDALRDAVAMAPRELYGAEMDSIRLGQGELFGDDDYHGPY